MSNESSTKKLPRPSLHVPPSKWSAAQTGGVATRVAIIGTVAAVIGGISLVFLYPYVNIDRYREFDEKKTRKDQKRSVVLF